MKIRKLSKQTINKNEQYKVFKSGKCLWGNSALLACNMRRNIDLSIKCFVYVISIFLCVCVYCTVTIISLIIIMIIIMTAWPIWSEYFGKGQVTSES